ncbi:hypothetical protein CEXT_670031 [Caerostris extrusa]|uniref:Uncharacterized protein n=1 Tax=Caerostris extrusa TaxID=172846 RepID=A0AAV4PD52_CAEEX|nr:hypothetical protein CEXT_670031 [Caerostris extrusa]
MSERGNEAPRVVCAIFRNLLEKPKELQIRRHNALMMIQCKILQCLDFLETRKDLTKDPEFVENFEKRNQYKNQNRHQHLNDENCQTTVEDIQQKKHELE